MNYPDRLHDHAEELADIAKHTEDPETREELLAKADALVRQAAHAREQSEAADDDLDLFEPYDDEVMYG